MSDPVDGLIQNPQQNYMSRTGCATYHTVGNFCRCNEKFIDTTMWCGLVYLLSFYLFYLFLFIFLWPWSVYLSPCSVHYRFRETLDMNNIWNKTKAFCDVRGTNENVRYTYRCLNTAILYTSKHYAVWNAKRRKIFVWMSKIVTN